MRPLVCGAGRPLHRCSDLVIRPEDLVRVPRGRVVVSIAGIQARHAIRQVMTRNEFAYKLVDLDVLSEVKPSITDLAPNQNRQPVETTGKPLSEVILEERR